MARVSPLKRSYLAPLLVLFWLVFVVSLATWWMLFGLGKLEQLSHLIQDAALLRQQRMLFMEGVVLVLSLFIGGLTLLFYVIRERSRLEKFKTFTLAFNHDMKTSIARLLFFTEKLQIKNEAQQSINNGLFDLQRQLENSLHVTRSEQHELVFEAIDIKNIISRLHLMWPDLKINFQGETKLNSDYVAIESIFKNLLSNSIIHGDASLVNIKIERLGTKRVRIHYTDDGTKTINQDILKKMGQSPQASQKGTGIGLYLTRQWVEELKGNWTVSVKSGHLHFMIEVAG